MPSNLYYSYPFSGKADLPSMRGNHRLIPLDAGETAAGDWQLPAVLLLQSTVNNLDRLLASLPGSSAWSAIYLQDGDLPLPAALEPRVFAVLPLDASTTVLEKAVARAFEAFQAHEERRQLETLNEIGVKLSSERNTDTLLELILTKSREITAADAGSLYVKEDEPEGGQHLVFKLAQNDSQSVPFVQSTLAINTESLAGYAAATGEPLNIEDVYQIPKDLPYRFNRDFDEKFGYRTKSMLVLPMQNQKGENIGVLQLINAKTNAATKLLSPEIVAREVVLFSPQSEDLASSLASQAAVALENNLLYRNIEHLFEGFVNASVTAVESRDPTTSGHSENVATLTVELAKTVDRLDTGPYRDIHFTREHIREIYYASILHDFGKVGVREEVLVKEKKLYPRQLEVIEKRFLYARKVLQLAACRKKLDHVLRNGNQGVEALFAKMDAQLDEQLNELNTFMASILQANEPTVLPQKVSDKLGEIAGWSLETPGGPNEPTLLPQKGLEKLGEIAGWSFDDPDGNAEPLLTGDEVHLLSISKGTLDAEEFKKIQEHVEHSFNFLKQIPWTKELKQVPEIARAHHEKLNGRGYYSMRADEIPFESKMMTISDIYDALTARDRPYKKAVPRERALTIIGDEVKSQLLDPELFQLFVDAKVYLKTAEAEL